MRSRNEVMTPQVVQGLPVDGLLPEDRTALQALVDAAYRKAPELRNLDAMRVGKLAEDVERYSALNARLFAEKTDAHRRAEAAEQDAARFRMLLQQHKHWLGVFRCDPDGAPSDSLDHVELKALLDQLIAREPAPDCKTPAGCAENGCLGWCDEHKPEGPKP